MAITIPSHLSDGELTAQLSRWARDERHTTAHVVAHLAEFDTRRLHLGAGYSSTFAYCREVLGFSEDAAYNRIEAARAGRMFPVVLEWLADGSLSLTVVRMLARLLTAENHQELLTAARRRGKREVEELIARRFPRPDVPSSVRRVPERAPLVVDPAPARVLEIEPRRVEPARTSLLPTEPASIPRATHRPCVKPLATDRYEFRFTGDTAMRDKMAIVRDLERHTVPDGDLARLVERAFDALIELRAMQKLAIVRKPVAKPRPTAAHSRHVPAAVKRAVWARDGGRCAFVGSGRHRCTERGFLEYHHVKPYAVGGEATVANIQLRCRAHNGYEADLFFGTSAPGVVSERATKYAVSWRIPPVPERVGDGRQHGGVSKT